MAEFHAVAGEMYRMCNRFCGGKAVQIISTGACTNAECPLRKASWEAKNSCFGFLISNPSEVERIATQWSRENPIRVFPTYREYILSLNPNMDLGILRGKVCALRACLGRQFRIPPCTIANKCDQKRCIECLSEEIDSCTAWLLGVQPKHVSQL